MWFAAAAKRAPEACHRRDSMISAWEYHTLPRRVSMHRATIVLDDEFVKELDRIIAVRGYQNRSEAVRDLARAGMRQAAEEEGASGDCVAALVYVYDHDERELAKRLTQSFHDHHDLSLSAMHVHL